MAGIFKSIGNTAFPLSPSFSVGRKQRVVNSKFTVQTTGAAGDQYVLAGPLTIDDRISRIYSQNMAALTTATNNNLGFYYSKDQLATPAGLVPVKASGGNELWSAVSLAAAVTTFADQLTGKNAGLDNTKAIRDLLVLGPDAEPVGGIYLVLTLTIGNTAGGTYDLDILIDEATTR